MKKVIKYKCDECGELFDTPEMALAHEIRHERIEKANEIWVKGVGYVENSKPYYQRLYRGKRSGYLKRQSNRVIRRYKGELHKGYQHIHKIFDFLWDYI